MKVKTKLFLSNRTQAVRLPKTVAFPENVKEVMVIQQDNGLLIVPCDDWDSFFDSPGVSLERNQPEAQERESF